MKSEHGARYAAQLQQEDCASADDTGDQAGDRQALHLDKAREAPHPARDP
ncbi:MAG: hypothetical protein M3Y55_01880 [Pseudomonadota bacterium]|nr:hypothetical protein [Pseudomonadota bacterium]